MEACEEGLGKVERREGGEVINGDSCGWFGFKEGEERGDGDAAGDALSSKVGDMTAAILS